MFGFPKLSKRAGKGMQFSNLDRIYGHYPFDDLLDFDDLLNNLLDRLFNDFLDFDDLLDLDGDLFFDHHGLLDRDFPDYLSLDDLRCCRCTAGNEQAQS